MGLTSETGSAAAISFDADQTLWDFADVHRRALESTLIAMVRRGDVRPGEVTAVDLQAAREDVMRPLRGKPHDLAFARERSFELVLSRLGHETPSAAAAELVDHYMDVRFGSIEMYPDVADALDSLRTVTRIGLLTNGNTDPDKCGLPGVFHAVVMGAERGLRKPEPAAFAAIAAELDVPVEELWHVGDHADDIDGANAVGATSVHIDRTGEPAPHAERANHQITTLADLPPLLKTINGV